MSEASKNAPPAFLGVSLHALPFPSWDERFAWAASHGFDAVEIPVTGEPWSVHTPTVPRERRDELAQKVAPFVHTALLAPSQATFDITLVSPSSAIRRASLAELWATCRFARDIGAETVLVRCGTAPAGVREEVMLTHLNESLGVLDKTAGEFGITIALLNRDWFAQTENYSRLRFNGLPHTAIALDITHAVGEDFGEYNRFLNKNAARVASVRVPLLSPPIIAGEYKTSANSPFLPALRSGSFGGVISLTAPAATAEKEIIAAANQWRSFLRSE